MHRISDVRMGGTALKNFAMFRQLCGEEFLQNVAIVTNMWSSVSADVGEARERQLRTSDLFFKPVLDKGAKILRHDGTKISARNILQQFLSNRPLSLRIQRELVEERKDITQTAACGELDREFQELRRRQEKELKELREQLEEAKQDNDVKAVEEMEATKKEIQDKLEAVRAQRQRLSEEYQEMKHLQAREDSQRRGGHQVREKEPSNEVSELRELFEEGRAEEARLRKRFEEAEERHRKEIDGLRQQLEQVKEESKRSLKDLMTLHAITLKLRPETLQQTQPSFGATPERPSRCDWLQTTRELQKQKRKAGVSEGHPNPSAVQDTRGRSQKSSEVGNIHKISREGWTLPRLPTRGHHTVTTEINADWQWVAKGGPDRREPENAWKSGIPRRPTLSYKGANKSPTTLRAISYEGYLNYVEV